jgi:hypothetical protein
MTPALSVYLDALRLLAALMVFAHHASYPIFGGRWISALGGYGHEAVVVFFVLSGFVIAFVTDVKERTPAAYAGSRLSRLWSVALPALAATLAMDAIGRQLAPQAYADVLVNPQGPLASALFVNEFWTAQWHVGSNIPFWLSYGRLLPAVRDIRLRPRCVAVACRRATLIGRSCCWRQPGSPEWSPIVPRSEPAPPPSTPAGRSRRRPGLWPIGFQGGESLRDLAVAEVAG